MKSLTARIIILNYNGEAMLPLCLPSIVEAARQAETKTAITILDNLSTDQSDSYVRKNFPEIEFVKAPANRILCSYNDFLPKIAEPIAILLNNDIRVAPGFIDPLIAKFIEDPKTFMVAPRVMSFDGSMIEAADSRAGFKWGLFWCDARYPGYEHRALRPSETFSSGFGAFSREKFLALNGYDDRFLPGIFEDVDLCLRARRAGYHLFYEPSSVVYHMGQASFKKVHGRSKIERLAARNSFLFMWKNFSGLRFWLPHLFFLPMRILFALLKGKKALWLGFFDALLLLKRIRQR